MEGLIPQDKPAPEFWQVRQELFRIGNNLNQLAATAHARGWLQAQRLDEALTELDKTNMELLDRQLPRKVHTAELLERGCRAESEGGKGRSGGLKLRTTANNAQRRIVLLSTEKYGKGLK